MGQCKACGLNVEVVNGEVLLDRRVVGRDENDIKYLPPTCWTIRQSDNKVVIKDGCLAEKKLAEGQ